MTAWLVASSYLREQTIGGGLLTGMAETAGEENREKSHDARERRGRQGCQKVVNITGVGGDIRKAACPF